MKLLIRLRLIRRRRIWIRAKRKPLSYKEFQRIVIAYFDRRWIVPLPPEEVRKDWEYQFTPAGELALRILNWFSTARASEVSRA